MDIDHLLALDEPLDVCVQDGEIAIIGPDGVGVSLTAAAARVSAQRLLSAAAAIDGGETYQKPLG